MKFRRLGDRGTISPSGLAPKARGSATTPERFGMDCPPLDGHSRAVPPRRTTFCLYTFFWRPGRRGGQTPTVSARNPCKRLSISHATPPRTRHVLVAQGKAFFEGRGEAPRSRCGSLKETRKKGGVLPMETDRPQPTPSPGRDGVPGGREARQREPLGRETPSAQGQSWHSCRPGQRPCRRMRQAPLSWPSRTAKVAGSKAGSKGVAQPRSLEMGLRMEAFLQSFRGKGYPFHRASDLISIKKSRLSATAYVLEARPGRYASNTSARAWKRSMEASISSLLMDTLSTLMPRGRWA